MGKLQAVTDVALSHLTLSDLMEALLPRVRETMGVDAVGILLIGDNDAGDTFTSGAVVTPRASRRAAAASRLRAASRARLAGTGEVVAIDAVNDPLVLHPLLKDSEIVSVAAAPMSVEGRLHGVLQIATTKRRKFTAADQGLLQLIARPRGARRPARAPVRARARDRRDAPARAACRRGCRSCLACTWPRVTCPAALAPTWTWAATGTTSSRWRTADRRGDRRRGGAWTARCGADGPAAQLAARVRDRGPSAGRRCRPLEPTGARPRAGLDGHAALHGVVA